MKDRKSPGPLVRNIILGVLLALVCVGGAELAACRHFAPDTYERVVAPVRYAATVTLNAGKAVVDAGGRFCQAAGAQIVEFGRWTAGKASAFWEKLTTGPEPAVPESDETPPPSSSPGFHPPVGDEPLTQVMEVDGRRILTGGSLDVVYFCQSDEEWANQLYGTDPIGPYGCGPTAMAMLVASMTDTDTDPVKMSNWVVAHGYWARQSGSYHSIVQGVAQGFGLEAEAITERTPEQLYEVLSSGGMVVALMGRGHFTNGGHFILLRGTTLTGDILVADPNSLENSLEVWDPQLILDELSSARDHGAPLWAVFEPTQ